MPSKKTSKDSDFIFRLMVDDSPFLILSNKKDATITFINKAIEKFFDIDRKNIIGKKWLSKISHEQKEEIKKNLIDASTSLKSFKYNVSYKLKNNEEKIVDWINIPIIDENGQFTGEFQAIGIDITDKYYVQNQLEEALNYLSLFFNQSLDGFFIMETDEPIEWNDQCNKEKSLRNFYHNFKITKVNKAFLVQYSAKENDIVGLSPADFFVHNYKYGLDVCEKILNSGSITLITDERKFNGEQIWIEAQYYILKNAEGLITSLFGIQRDITEKVKLENDLKENLSIFKSSFEKNPLPMWIYDLETTKILAVNNAAIKSYGYSKEEFLKMKLKDFQPQDDIEKLNEEINFLKDNPKIQRTQNWRHFKKDGSIIDVEIRASYINYKNKDARIVVVTDITEKLKAEKFIKESEESYKGLFNSITDAIYIQDKNGVFLNVNSGAEKMYGYNREEFIGRTPQFLSAPRRNDFQHVIDCINETFSTGKTNSFEFWGKRKNGEIFPKDVTINKAKYFGNDVIIAIARDITEKKKFEASLELSKENFKSIFNQFHEAIIIHDFYGNIIEANQKTLKLYGYKYEEITKLKIHNLSSEVNMQLFRLNKIWDKVKSGNLIEFEWISKNKNGNEFEVKVSLQKNFWSGKEVIFAFVQDITKQKEIEKALIETEESYSTLFNSINDMIFILNYDGKIIEFNNYVKTTLQINEEDLLNKTLTKVSAPQKNNYSELLEKISTTYYTGNPTQLNFWFQKNNGEQFLCEIKLTNTKYNNSTVVFALARDITQKELMNAQLKESEKRFRDLYENATIGIFRTTFDGKIIFANKALANILGFESFEEIKNYSVQDYFYPDKEIRNKNLRELNEKGFLKGVEFELLKKDKAKIIVRENSRVIRNHKGVIEYIEGTIEDITEKKIFEKNLLESQEYLKQLNATKDKFFSIIAHDLRSPFQGLLGISNILAEEEMPPEEKDFYFKRLHDGLKNLFNLIEDLLTWSRVQRDKLEFTPETSNLAIEITEIINLLQDSMIKKTINLETEIEEDLTCKYDKFMINTVIRNLISNAIKFTPTFGNILIKAYKTEAEIIFSIKDSGIGISNEDKQKIFRLDTPFTRRGTNDEPGTGLGLILCKEFINKHNGKIWVESEEGKGSNFSFTIPLE